MDWIVEYLQEFTYVGVAVVLFVAGLGVPFPEDIPLIFGGAMAGAGKINVYIHFAISIVFILIGDTCLFFIGRKLGSATEVSPRWQRIITPERRAKVVSYFDRYGSWTVFFGRFVAGIRGAVFLSAGAANFPFWRFLVLDLLAALVSVPVWIWLGYKFGQNWEAIMEKAKATQGWVLLGLVLVVVLTFVGLKLYRRRKVVQPEESR